MKTGVGFLLNNYRKLVPDKPLKVGLIGLGIGTLAAYAEPGDTFRFYELNPGIIELARGRGDYFSYLKNSRAPIETILGDARLSLGRELAERGSNQFDILILDAFSSDSIPSHLLTREAFNLYSKHIKPGGVIAAHISNRFIDLQPVIRAAARDLDFYFTTTSFDKMESEKGILSSTWSFLSMSKEISKISEFNHIHKISSENTKGNKVLVWTDDYTPLLPIIDWM